MKSKMDYAAPAWQPWLSVTSAFLLDKKQDKAIRLVTGQLKTTVMEPEQITILPIKEKHASSQ